MGGEGSLERRPLRCYAEQIPHASASASAINAVSGMSLVALDVVSHAPRLGFAELRWKRSGEADGET